MYSFTKQTDIFTFGKHKGEDIDTVIKKDTQYVQWCVENHIINIESKELQKAFKAQCVLHSFAYGSGYDEDDAEMDFCMGLGGGAQGWD